MGQPLIGVFVERDGTEFVQYFTDEAALDEALGESRIEEALSLAGAWEDLDWEEAAEELDRIRHESTPTPPIEL
jgi:hypothetical protein